MDEANGKRKRHTGWAMVSQRDDRGHRPVGLVPERRVLTELLCASQDRQPLLLIWDLWYVTAQPVLAALRAAGVCITQACHDNPKTV